MNSPVSRSRRGTGRWTRPEPRGVGSHDRNPAGPFEVFIAGMRRRYADLMHEDTVPGDNLATVVPAGRA